MEYIEHILKVVNSDTVRIPVTAGVIVIIAALGLIAWLRFVDLKRIYKQKKVFIEVTPPREASKTPAATEQLFHMLHSLGSTQRFRYKVLRRRVIFSLEVVSTKREGVRYIIGTGEHEADSIERDIATFLSNSRTKRIEDPLLAKNEYTKVKEFKQTKHFALSIRTLDTFELHDPIAYIIGEMNRLSENEQVVMQLILSPAKVRNMAAIVQRYREFYKISEATHNKAYGHLFKTELRVRVVASSAVSLKERVRGMESAIGAFSIPKVQTLKARYNFPYALRGRLREWVSVHRMPSLLPRNSNIFSSLELANIYHFPADQTTTEGVAASLSRTLAPSLSIINNVDYDVVLGDNVHRGISTPIGLTAAEREKHAFIVGGTGSGKTTLLKYAIVQDIKNGKGVAVIDPHGDLAQELLELIPEERIKDVIYFNPRDVSHPIGLNLLEIPEGLTGDELLVAKDFITEMVVSIMRKTFSEDGTGGHRIEYILRNAVLTALSVEGATIFTVYDLLTDKDYRTPIVNKLEQKWLRNFWKNEYSQAGGMQQVKMMHGVTSKIGRYHTSVSAERILEQSKSTINFDEILDGKILICNLAKGKIGEDTSEIFGISILTQLQLAAYRRIDQERADRRPFYAYVDEFQNFATTSFVEMLSEARKYKLFLIMAEQTTAQQDDDNMVNIIINNTGTIICFKSNSLADERQMLHLFKGIEPGEIANLSAYSFYAKLSGGLEPQPPISGMTIVLDEEGDKNVAEAVIEASRTNYAKRYDVEKKRKASTGEDQKPSQKDTKDDSESSEDELMSDSEGVSTVES